jgi:hypothetical protein
MLWTLVSRKSKSTTQELVWIPFKSHPSVRQTQISDLVVLEEQGQGKFNLLIRWILMESI